MKDSEESNWSSLCPCQEEITMFQIRWDSQKHTIGLRHLATSRRLFARLRGPKSKWELVPISPKSLRSRQNPLCASAEKQSGSCLTGSRLMQVLSNYVSRRGRSESRFVHICKLRHLTDIKGCRLANLYLCLPLVPFSPCFGNFSCE